MDTDRVQERLREEAKRLRDVKAALEGEGIQGIPDPAQFAELASYDQHAADVGSETFERERILAIGEGIDAQMRAVDDALRRISDGTFGKCEVCGEAIPEERLEARPMARYCLEHQKQVEDGLHPVAGADRPGGQRG